MNPSPRQVFSDPVLLLAFGLGSGLSPKAPGTAGTLMALPFLLLAITGLAPEAFVLATLLISLVGIPICGKASQRLGVHDHGGIVWDEFAGLFVTALPLVLGVSPPAALWLELLLCFIAFRVFDVLKPWPIKWLDQHVHGGLGIMLDDLLAGVFAGFSVCALLMVWPF